MSMYGGNTVPFPPPSPMGSPNMLAQPISPIPNAQVQPGTITYTTSTSPDGRMTYHPFKAVPASYQTPNGVVSGIQWIPAEATQVLPQGAMPATAEFAASWGRPGHGHREEERALREWQKDEDKRRRREEREASKRRERDREDKEIRRARERDARGSRYGTPGVPGGMAGGVPGYPAYGAPPGAVADLEGRFNNVDIGGRRDYERERRNSVNYGAGRTRKGSVGDYDNRRKSVYNNEPVASGFTPAGYPGGRAASPYNGAGILPPPSPIRDPMRDASNPGYAPAAGYPTSAIPPSPGRPQDPYQRSGSPFQRGASPYYGPPGGVPQTYSSGSRGDGPMLSRSRAPSPIPGGMPYPRSRAASPIPGVGAYSHSRAPSPIPGAGGMPYGARSRAASPIPGAGPYSGAPGFPQATVPGRAPPSPRPSPRMGGSAPLGYPGEVAQPLSTPEGFGRPPNLAQSYTWFDTMKVQDMDDFLDVMPRMPLVLVPHDVYHEDWIRFMQDVALAWAGKLPTADAGHQAPRRSRMTADLIELWNMSFFQQRGVEVVLYKGRERRSGPAYGTIDARLPGFDSDDYSSSDSSSDLSESDLSDEAGGYGRAGPYGAYGRTNDVYSNDPRDSKRRQREKKAEKKRRHKEKKAKRRAREKQKTYALYLTCVTPREGGPQY